MTVQKRSTVVGVFHDQTSAQKAVAELRRVGFTEDQIGVVSRQDESAEVGTDTPKDENVRKAAATGAVAGAGVGALWALGIVTLGLPAVGPAIAGGIFASILASAAGTAAAGGILGALVGLGIPEEEAKHYDTAFKAGRTLVTVRAPGKYVEADAILRRFGASNIQNPSATAGVG